MVPGLQMCGNAGMLTTDPTGDVMLYVVGGADENEIMLYNVVLALRDSLNILLK